MNILSRISEWRKSRSDRKKAEEMQAFYKRVQNVFQITECNGEMWFTFDDKLICPCSLFGDDAIGILNELRRLYFINYFKNE